MFAVSLDPCGTATVRIYRVEIFMQLYGRWLWGLVLSRSQETWPVLSLAEPFEVCWGCGFITSAAMLYGGRCVWPMLFFQTVIDSESPGNGRKVEVVCSTVFSESS